MSATGQVGGGAAGRLQGLGVSGGQGAGPVARLVRGGDQAPADRRIEDPEAEVRTLEAACATVAASLRERVARASTDQGRDVLEAGAMMAEDRGLRTAATTLVLQRRLPAELAVWEAAGVYADKLRAIGGYLGERAHDVLDVRARVVAHLLGVPVPGMPERDHPFVLVADDLAPADTAGLDPSAVTAVVTREGGPTGHTAIIARSLGIPTVVACPGSDDLADGELVVVDGSTGSVARGVAPEQVEATETARRRRTDATPLRLPDGPVLTLDGHPLRLLANVGDEAGAAAAAGLGITGAGLFRTELLFLERTQPPSREEQAAAYTAVLRHLGGRVVVRTLDAGADKPLPFLTFDEPNPALGVRGLRAMLDNVELLDDQLHAVVDARDATGADVWVMAPMVTTVEEAGWFRDRCHAAGLRTVGVMIEVPAAALLAGELLDVVDFVSIGTNDLTQYTMAADRVLGRVAALNDPWQPAVLRLVSMTAAAGATRGRPAGVCGEAAADPDLAAVLVGLGVRSLSATPSAVPAVAGRLAGLTLSACERAAAAVLTATSPQQARALAADLLEEEVAGAGSA